MSIILITALSLGGLAFLAGVVLYIAATAFAVEEDPLVQELNDILPQANCGACGVPGCLPFAEKLVKTKDPALHCPVGGQDLSEEIAELMGMEPVERERMVARVLCNGGHNATRTGEYKGVKSCIAVKAIGQNDVTCSFGCMGHGDCVTVCDFDSIHIVNGVALVDEEKCTACEACITECPINIIQMQPYNKTVFVACTSTDPGGAVKKYCTVGCTGCKLCVKACEYEAILFENSLATIIPEKCTNCNDCVDECGPNTIVITKKGLAELAENPRPKKENAEDAAEVNV